ncbi:MAG: hypothetical protein LRY41_00575 [Candidatus Pacebacteria bacterium]|nr:hypothetical protein [Candidatus Paceibacterota bacterium]
MDHCDDIAHCSDLFARKKMSHFNNTHQISPGQAYALELIPVLKTVYIKDIMRMFARKRDIFLAGYHALVLAYQLAPEVFMAGKNIHTISLATCIPCDSFGNRRSAYVIKDPVEKTFNFKTIPIKKSMYKGEYILMFRLIAE